MPSIQQIFREEIRKQVKRELKLALQPIQTQFALLRKTVIEQKMRIKELEKQHPAPVVVEAPPVENKEVSKKFRITAEQVSKLRKKLAVSQSDYAKLLGVSAAAVSLWETGRTLPREEQKRKIAALRDMGKRELKKLFAEKEIKLPTTGEQQKKKTSMTVESASEDIAVSDKTE